MDWRTFCDDSDGCNIDLTRLAFGMTAFLEAIAQQAQLLLLSFTGAALCKTCGSLFEQRLALWCKEQGDHLLELILQLGAQMFDDGLQPLMVLQDLLLSLGSGLYFIAA